MSIDFKIEEDYEGLKKLKKNADQSQQGEGLNVEDILNDVFLLEHTDFQNYKDLFNKAGFKADTPEEIASIPQEQIDAFVKANTKFDGFNDMLSQALSVNVQKRLLKVLK
ncbi:hypothetical protein NCZ17_01980 [Acinetobacter modestus]|uniref:hypothetical protein n=1 Tax=Acinetobacter modestus TaxID=1776740 RepID=UPI00202E13FD|nr:hypothetical protein [Acinetobacter modestus]MCM1958140.1 hypothetical protein [Acinetobacter modestus]